MIGEIRAWFRGLMKNRDLAVLLVTAPIVLLVAYLLLGYLSPLFVGILFAYLLERPAKAIEAQNLSRTVAVSAVLVLFLMLATTLVLLVFPTLTQQLQGLMQQLPKSGEAIARAVERVNSMLPDFVPPINIDDFGTEAGSYVADFGRGFLETTLASVSDIFTLIVYGVLMPLLVFFLMRDKQLLFQWLNKFIPHNPIFGELYASVDEQFGAYIRGKVIEGLIVGAMSGVAFALFELQYTFVLAFLVGISVIIPFVGAVLVTFPVLIVGYLQFGASDTFLYLSLAYLVIQMIDGQVIVPILFSEVVKIHPVGILVAIIFFGNLWGVWGVFFAIPLASLIKSFLAVVEKNRAPADPPDPGGEGPPEGPALPGGDQARLEDVPQPQ